MCIVVFAPAMQSHAIVEEWYIMNPNVSGWRGERGTVFVQQSNCRGRKAVGHSGGPSLKGPIPPTRGQKVDQRVCCVRKPVS